LAESDILAIRESFEQLYGIYEINLEKCIGCGRCEKVCPYNAIKFVELTKEFEDVSLPIKKSQIDSKLCKGCGMCASTCPNNAISELYKDYDQFPKIMNLLF
jgi:heterodisulfide reductase subunit A